MKHLLPSRGWKRSPNRNIISAVRFSSRTSFAGGLIGPSSTDKYYAKTLDLQEAGKLFMEPGFLWSAAEADAVAKNIEVKVYIEQLLEQSQRYFHTDELHDRGEYGETMRFELSTHKGAFVLLLGGRSFGKTFVMRKLVEEQRAYAVDFEKKRKERQESIIKLRQAAEADDSIAEAPRARGNPVWKPRLKQEAAESRSQAAAIEAEMEDATMRMPRRFITYNASLMSSNLIRGFMTSAYNHLGPELFARLVASASGTMTSAPESAVGNLTLHDLLEAYIGICKQDGFHPCLIIEKCSAAFPTTNEALRQQSLDALQMFTAYTKESRRMTVVMTDAEFTEPDRLFDIGLHGSDLKLVLAPEVAPAAMRDLLQNKWGMGQHLASAMMSVWGGA